MKPRIKPMTPGIPHAARVRAYLAALAVTAGLSGVAWRAWALQIHDGDRYRVLAARQHALTVEIPAPRGDVIDARGRPLAVTADAESIWAHPHDIRDVTDTAARIAALIGGSPAALEAKLGGDRRFLWLARHVTPELARRVRGAHLAGIEVGSEPRRWYPERSVGGTVIGRSDIDGNGVDGVELAMNAQLNGLRGEGSGLRDVRGKRMFAGGLERPQPGATVQLSLDTTIQASAEAAIGDAVRAHHARSGVVVVLEVATGRVVAMASAPSLDPNGPSVAGVPAAPPAGPDDEPSAAAVLDAMNAASPDGASGSIAPKPHEPARNRAVADAYEAGSVMKIFSIAAALEEGTVTPDTEFDLGGGQFQLSARLKPIRDVDHDPYLTVAGIIKRSSNVGAAKIALKLGATRLYAALRRFGFGARTGIELPGEQTGMLRNGARWRDIELATISYGYGLTATPLQIAAALAALGNGGVYHEPRIVERVIDGDGTLLYAAQAAERRVVSERTAAQMVAMMATVFEGGKQAGTAATIVVPGFRCAGKTGTARRYDPAVHAYALDRYRSSFAGLAPLDHPRLAIVALVDDPSGGDYYGAKVAGPVFARVASEALRYLGVPGEPEVCPPAPAGVPAAAASGARTCIPAPPTPRSPAAGSGAAGSAATATASGGRPAPGALPTHTAGAASELVASSDGSDPMFGTWSPWLAPPFALPSPPVPVRSAATTTPAPRIPDFRGMGMARALTSARDAHLAAAVTGTGRVVEQQPPPGAGRGATRVWLRLADGNAVAPAARSP
ncbi:MAG TPA: penicillin-binding transpeptidase domain-containing protein [Kofleriaceae bacterium]|nr:penicillin-binding transpeptidase domain-containing protein [Kofleriaceae bacterium]